MSSTVRFGYGFDFRNPQQWQRPWADLYAEHLEFIALTEELGFRSVWLSEHHGMEDGYLPSPLMIGAAVAARTKRLRIAQGIGLAPLYHPVRLAEDIAVLDILSNGRAELCLAVGYLTSETETYGVPFKARGKRADELLQIVRPLLQGETVSFDGAHFTIKNARVRPLPVQKPGIPIFIGGSTALGFRRAARFGDGFMGPIESFPDYAKELTACGKDENAARLVSMGAGDLWFVVSEDPEKTIEEVAPHAYYQISSYAKWQEDMAWGPFTQMDLEQFKKSGLMKILTPDQAIDYIRSRLAVAPVEAFCMHAPAGFPLSKLAAHAELFAKKVMPAFR